MADNLLIISFILVFFNKILGTGKSDLINIFFYLFFSHANSVVGNGDGSFFLVIQSPQNNLEARELCDHLKSNKPIIMNVEGVDTPLAQRMVDFLSGAVYCLDGDIQKISTGIFLATPASIEITGDLKDEMRNKGVFSWVK